MRRIGKPLAFALYAAFAAGLCILQYLHFRGAFSETVPHEHSIALSEPDEPLYLDLNDASAAELARLPGVSRPLAEEITAHRERIGGFTGFQELLEVKGMPEQLYLALGEYLYLTPVETQPSTATTSAASTKASTAESVQTTTETTTAVQFPLDLNAATLEELCQLPGIGEVTASAIIAHRDACGGFYNRMQLLEVSGIGEITLEKILPYLYLPNEQPMPEEPPPAEPEPEPVVIETEPETTVTETVPPTEPFFVDLNTASAEELLRLPGCDEGMAENILHLREMLHGFRNTLELLYADGMTNALYLAWEPYLAVDAEGNQQLPEEETQTEQPASE